MAGNIKGITIELNGDTTKLDKALRNVNKVFVFCLCSKFQITYM